ncbi:MAG: hypothetical protein AAF411_23555 [Myxococcota bacterium]
MAKLPLLGARGQARTGEGGRTLLAKAMVVVPAYETAPMWPMLRDASLPVFALGDAEQHRVEPRERPVAHTRIAGPRASCLDALPREPLILAGEVAGRWVRGACLVVVAGAVGPDNWSPLARELEPDLVLRSPRYEALRALERRLRELC